VKQLLVISGKGGTGKTTLVASFSRLAESAVLADCDVDAPDLHFLMGPRTIDHGPFYGGKKPRVDPDRCTGCGTCTELCRFGAIEAGEVDPVTCEGCGLCALGCPEGAIEMVEHLSGHWFVSETPFGPMVHAQLEPGEENSGKLVAEVKRRAKELAETQGREWVLIDGPPGVGCPVISSLSGVDVALIVTEPTVAALHDLDRVLELCERFGVRALVCINRYDLNRERATEIRSHCARRGVEVVGMVPFDRRVIEALAVGRTPMEHPCRATEAIREIWEAIARFVP